MIVTAAGGEPGEVLRAADLGQRAVLVEQVLQRDRVGDLAAVDQLADRRVDAAVHGVGEMLGPQEVGDPAVRGVVDRIAPSSACSASVLSGGARDAVEIGLRAAA